MKTLTHPLRITRLGVALAIVCAAISPAGVFPQAKTPSGKKVIVEAQPANGPAAIARGLVVFKDRCAICHFSESEAKKIGPGLKGIYIRGKFSDGGKVDDASVEDRVLSGGKNMPSFKLQLNPNQIRDLIAYLKTSR